MDSITFDQLVADYPNAIRILAEGDSWFAYPRRYVAFGTNSNVIDWLGKSSKYVIYTTSSNGDEALSMVTGEQKHALMKRIKANHYDFILFSGGGNDIVGRYDFDFFVEEKRPGMQAIDCIKRSRLERKLVQIAAAYEELIERASQYSVNPAMKIVTHTYDFPLPMKKGFALFDIFPLGESWMYPILMDRKITDLAEQRMVVKTVLSAFKDTLLSVQQKYPGRFSVVNTQGKLADSQWRNVIHPTPAGFRLIANEIAAELDRLSAQP